MSKRNYSPKAGPLGKYRDPGDTPPNFPHVDTDAIMELSEWRTANDAGPILDELNGYYRFTPVSAEGAKRYVGAPRARAVGKKAVQEMLSNKEDVIAAGQRQVIHIAKNTEETLAIFWSIASQRYDVLKAALRHIVDETEMPDEIAAWAADSILDLGQCIDEPFTGKDARKKAALGPVVMPDAIKHIAPEAGRQVIGFANYAIDNPTALYSDEGIILLQTTFEEQEHRMQAWAPRHQALTEAFPQIPTSDDVLLERVGLDELLQMQQRLAD